MQDESHRETPAHTAPFPTVALWIGALLFDLGYLISFALVPRHDGFSYLAGAGLILAGWSAYRILSSRQLCPLNPVLAPLALLAPATVYRLSLPGPEPSAAANGAGTVAAGGGLSLRGAGLVIDDPGQRAGAQPYGVLLLVAVLLLGSATNFLGDRVVNPALAPVDDAAETYLNRALVAATASYASARVIDRSLSVVTESQVGVGVSVKPGQLFKPIQDMAVRYSDFMVFVMVSLGVQRIGIELAQAGAIPVLGTLFLLCVAASRMGPESWQYRSHLFGRAALVLLLAFRLGVPLIGASVAAVSGAVLEDRREQAQAQVDVGAAQVEEVPEEAASAEGFASWVRGLWDQAAEAATAARAFTDDLVNQFVQLVIVYVVEVVILPIVLLIVLWRLARSFVVPAGGRALRDWRAARAEMLESRGSDRDPNAG